MLTLQLVCFDIQSTIHHINRLNQPVEINVRANDDNNIEENRIVRNYLESVRNVANQETLRRRHCATLFLQRVFLFFLCRSLNLHLHCIEWRATELYMHILIAWTQNWKHSNAPLLVTHIWHTELQRKTERKWIQHQFPFPVN